MNIKKNLTSAETKAFWDHVEQTSKKVDSWPYALMSSTVFTDSSNVDYDTSDRTIPEVKKI